MSEKIMGYTLDVEQQKIVEDESKYLLVVAGAGSGKTLTILGKINYLINKKQIDPSEILCLTFTNAAAKSLTSKFQKTISNKLTCYTFHKLALEILKKKDSNFLITDPNTLEDIIHEFLFITILDYSKYMNLVLKYFEKGSSKNIPKEYLNLLNKNAKDIECLEKSLSTFLHLFKCNNYTINDFTIFLKKIKKTLSYKKYKREKIFLILALNLLLQYEDYLTTNNELDFDDLIIEATKQIKTSPFKENVKYVIIDEYQDTSYIRFLLIKEILEKSHANLMVVGDDFQSIYRFTGCSLSLFLNFTTYFNKAKIMKIQTTYRNSQELIKIAGDFVMKNKKQVRKNLISKKHINNPIKIIYYENIKTSFIEIIEEISTQTSGSILVLGRNNRDVNLILDNNIQLKAAGRLIYKKNSNLNITYMTVHKSKGLESDNVILLNLKDVTLGFPTKLQDEEILRLVNPISENYPYSEERRLFYVALTRTKNYVYLLTPKINKSIFVEELEKDYCLNCQK